MMFIWLIVAIPLVIYLVAGPGESWGHGSAPRVAAPAGSAPPYEDPIAIARRRLARGEITPADFEDIRRRIGG